jgi:hypothetical protein
MCFYAFCVDVCCINKLSGFCSIAKMFKAIGRLIRARQEQWIIETSVQPTVKFQILFYVRYVRAKIAADQAINNSSNAGLGKEVQKSGVVTLSEEVAMLNSPATDPLTTSSLNARMGWYCGKNFFMYGGQDLRDLNCNQFELVKDEFGDEGLRFVILIIIFCFCSLCMSYMLPVRYASFIFYLFYKFLCIWQV